MTSSEHPRDIGKNEQPRRTREPAIVKVKAELLMRAGKIEQQTREIELDAANANTHKSRASEQLKAAAAQAELDGRPLQNVEYTHLRVHEILSPSAFDLAYYAEALEIVRDMNLTEPDIDRVNTTQASPGSPVWLFGTCFGPSQGKVFIELALGKVVELEVRYWDESFIDGYINPIIGDVPLRPYYGRIWISTHTGVTSNVWPIRYSPIYSTYVSSWTKTLRGHGGNHEDGVFLDNCVLGDPDFTIIQVDHSHSGEGWSEKRSPFAQERSMAQGYHIGVSWFGEARMHLLYAVKGPKGITPPPFEHLGDWYWINDW